MKKRARTPENEDGLTNSFEVDQQQGLEVNVMKEDSKPKSKISKLLPQPPFLMTVVAQRASGKTNMVIDMLTDDNKLCKYFDLVFVWSTSYYHDSKWKNIHLPCEHITVHEKYDLPAIQHLFQTLQELAKTKRMNTLFVFDDMIDQNVMHAQQMGVLEGIAVRGRHYNISIIVISQLYKKLSSPMRVNSTNLVFFRIRNRNELEKVTEENQESLSKKDFLKVYDFATNTPFAFLHINNQEADPALRFRKNWNTIIKIPTYTSINV